MDVLLTNLQSLLSIRPTLLLQTPSSRVVEVERVTWAVSGELKEVANVDVRVGLHLLEDLTSVGVSFFDFPSEHPVACTASFWWLTWSIECTTDGNVDDYILLLIDEVLEALIDGRIQIDVPDSAAIHEDVTI